MWALTTLVRAEYDPQRIRQSTIIIIEDISSSWSGIEPGASITEGYCPTPLVFNKQNTRATADPY